MGKLLKTFFCTVPVWILSPCVHAGPTFGAGTEYMSWREYESTGQKILEETGLRAFVDMDLSLPVSQRADFRAYGRLYGGDVDYDGQYQDGTPATTIVRYRGGKGEVGIGYGVVAPEAAYEPPLLIANLGVDVWRRDITGNGGYVEDYQVTYLRVGVEQNSPGVGWIGRGGLLWPFLVQERVGLLDGISLKPEGSPSLYAGGGYRLANGLEVGLDYHSYRFNDSDWVYKDTDGDGVVDTAFKQPRSELDTIGAYLKFPF